ncbi:uncharacterized protein MONBRDRAFT_8918 [Monosiga brevicollis MX1]|uniref:Ion transport domain-containing protein n=1 Tax=Monosiga brevicollis TaxID=81824 RepID=A9V1I5_MONBE|nr:uncharacterized protein MONBRDRAFT_8918 [Monosiga brevicollis MX1]EDQ88572.1 predicted protein [Monosiga brevicollis MX1]|eukprot:XP_001746676.1 hypothetical protein [Monosiga brevicollis MX1]
MDHSEFVVEVVGLADPAAHQDQDHDRQSGHVRSIMTPGRKLVLDIKEAVEFPLQAYAAVHPQRPVPVDEIDLCYMDGTCLDLSQEADLRVLKVLATDTLRARGLPICLLVKLGSESWSDQVLSAVPEYLGTSPAPPPVARDTTTTPLTPAGYLLVEASVKAEAERVREEHAKRVVDGPRVSFNFAQEPRRTAVTTFPVAIGEAPSTTLEAETAATGDDDLAPVFSPSEGDGDNISDVLTRSSAFDFDNPAFLSDEELALRSVSDDDDDRNSDCIWWLKANHPISRFFEISTMIVILISVCGFVFETLPAYRLGDDGEPRTDNHPTFFTIESVCIAWFTIEYGMRFYAAGPTRLTKWMWEPMNLIDLIAILPYYIGLGLNSSGASSVAVVRILRLTRISRLLKFSRHSEGLQDMIVCISKSSKELVLLFLITIVAATLFGSAIFYCEQDADSGFISIPEGMWWAVVTMTTVGYGDISPTTTQGKIVGSLVASIGVVLMAIPAGIFISEFMRLHQERQLSDAKLLKHEVILQRLRNRMDDVNHSISAYVLAREEHSKRMQIYYRNKLADQAAANNASTGSESRRRSSAKPNKYEGQLYQLDMDDIQVSNSGPGTYYRGTMFTTSGGDQQAS